MNVKLISITPDAEKIILYCARVSNPSNQDSSNTKLLDYCIQNKHWSVFEMANLCVEINTSRMISPQILRHWVFSYQEYSQRYAAIDDSGIEIYAARRQDKKDRQNSVDDLPQHIKDEWIKRQNDNWKYTFSNYDWAIKNNIAKECARAVLPLQTSTTLYMNGTIRDYIHYIDLRSGNGTQKEHKDIADAIKDIFCAQLPIISKSKGWII